MTLIKHKLIALKYGFPPKEILLDELREVFNRMQTHPPIRSEFSHELQYEIALDLYNSGKTGLCALARLLEANVFWFKNGQRASKNDISNCLLDVSGGRENKIADQINNEGLPCNTLFQIYLLEGEIFFDKLTDEEKSFYNSYNSSFIKGIATLYYFYCLNEGGKSTQIDQKLYWYNLAILLTPELPFVYLRILRQTDIRPDLKEQYIKLFLNYNSNDPLSLYYLSEYYIGIKDYQNAKKILSMAIEHASKPAILYIKRGDIYVAEGNADIALADYYKAIELDPDSQFSTTAYCRAASVLADKHEYDKALELLDLAIQKANPQSQEYTSSLTIKAIILYSLNRVKEAIQIGRLIWGNDLLDDQILSILRQYLSGPQEVQ